MCFFFQAEDGIRDADVTGVQTCALPICEGAVRHACPGYFQEGLVAGDVVEGWRLHVRRHTVPLHGLRTILPNCLPSARRRCPSTPSASGMTVSTMARSRPRKSSRIT